MCCIFSRGDRDAHLFHLTNPPWQGPPSLPAAYGCYAPRDYPSGPLTSPMERGSGSHSPFRWYRLTDLNSWFWRRPRSLTKPISTTCWGATWCAFRRSRWILVERRGNWAWSSGKYQRGGSLGQCTSTGQTWWDARLLLAENGHRSLVSTFHPPNWSTYRT